MNPNQCRNAPKDGVNVHGLFLQGCAWNWDGWLDESKPKVLFELMPVIWIEPVNVEQDVSQGCYRCPLYKTSTRFGVLSTTGHSTNFILYMDLRTKV